jgi:hypothetical protein
VFVDGASLYAALGRDFSLVAFGDADTSGIEAAAHERHMPLTVVRHPATTLPEPYENNLVLVRPDHHIAWHGLAPPHDPGAILDRIYLVSATSRYGRAGTLWRIRRSVKVDAGPDAPKMPACGPRVAA